MTTFTNVTSINENSDSSLDWSVKEMLLDILKQIEEEGEDFLYNKMFMCLLNNDDGNFTTGFRMANMRSSEAISLLELLKIQQVVSIFG